MISIKTAKALSLSLLLSFTASIAAEGLTEWFKSKITPKNVAIAATVGLTGAYSAYHHWVKRRPTRTLTLIANGQENQIIDVRNLGLALSNCEHIRGRIERNTYPTLLEGTALDHVLIDEQSGEPVLNLTPSYEINDNLQEVRRIRLTYNKRIGQMHLPWNWFGCFCCSNSVYDHTPEISPFARLYNEDALKAAYADQLAEQGKGYLSEIKDPSTSEIRRTELQARRDLIERKHMRVLGLDN